MSRRARTLNTRSVPWAGLDPERRNALLLIGAVSLAVGFAIALVAYGYYNDRIAPRHETMLKVGNREFDYAFLERRARAEFGLGTFNARAITQGIAATLALIEREEVVRQTARQSGLSASDAEVDAQIREMLGLKEDASRDDFAARYRDELLRIHLSPAEYRDIALAELLQQKFESQIEAGIPAQTDFVSLRIIQVETQTEAAAAKARVEKDEYGGLGTSFGVAASQLSAHASSANGGELGWVPRGALTDEVEQVAFSVTGLSDAIETDAGFFLLYVRGTEVRDVSEVDRLNIVQQSLREMLNKTRVEAGSQISASEEQLQRLAVSLARSLG